MWRKQRPFGIIEISRVTCLGVFIPTVCPTLLLLSSFQTLSEKANPQDEYCKKVSDYHIQEPKVICDEISSSIELLSF